MGVIVIAHNVRSAHNVGSLFRTADAMGVECMYLTGYTPAPIDTFNRPRKDIAKTALGAEHTVPWERHDDIYTVLSDLKKKGYTICALEQHAQSREITTYTYPQKIALILGNEVEGISPDLLEIVDVIVEIPMRGRKESLNVSVAAGIALFVITTLVREHVHSLSLSVKKSDDIMGGLP